MKYNDLVLKLVLQGYIFIGQMCCPLEGINESTTDCLSLRLAPLLSNVASHWLCVPTCQYRRPALGCCSSNGVPYTVTRCIAYDTPTLPAHCAITVPLRCSPENWVPLFQCIFLSSPSLLVFRCPSISGFCALVFKVNNI